MVGTPHLQPAPAPSSDTCVRAVTRQVELLNQFSFLMDLILDSQSQGGLEEAVVVVVVVVVVVDHQVNVFEGESQVAERHCCSVVCVCVRACVCLLEVTTQQLCMK